MARLDEWVPDLPGHCATLIYCLLTKMSALVNQIQVSNAVVSSNVWGVLESPMPLNPGQGSDSPGTIAATHSTL